MGDDDDDDYDEGVQVACAVPADNGKQKFRYTA